MPWPAPTPENGPDWLFRYSSTAFAVISGFSRTIWVKVVMFTLNMAGTVG